jgi:hypothetical protein
MRYIEGISLLIRRDLNKMESRSSSILDHFLNVGCGMVNDEDETENIQQGTLINVVNVVD